MASLTFSLQDPDSGMIWEITITEEINLLTGLIALRFDVALTSTGIIGDLRGLFFDVQDATVDLNDLSVSGTDVTDSDFEEVSVSNLGQGANVNGEVVNEFGKFDAGVEIGTAGISNDDIQTTSFVLSSSSENLSLDMISEQDFALRVTSVGTDGGARNDSAKIGGVSAAAPEGTPDIDAFVASLINQVLINQGGAQGGTEGTFTAPLASQPPGGGLSDISEHAALGDLDGDGDLDAFVAYFGGNTPGVVNQVVINQGGAQGGTEGTFTLPAASQPPPGATRNVARDVALGDLDGDGDLDAFVAYDGVNETSQVVINQGGLQGGTEGTFTAPAASQPPGGGKSFGVALGDLDGDGDLDAFVVNIEGTVNQVVINQGGLQGGTEGTFTAPAASQPPGLDDSRGVALGDLDGDGDLDAFVANNGANQVVINQGGLQGGTEGTFTAPAASQPPGVANSQNVALGDLDGDGDMDAFIVNFDGANQVLINQGGLQGGTQGTFTAPAASQPPGADSSVGVALGDLDADGDLDVIVANFGANQVLINDGTGIFTAPLASQPPPTADAASESRGVALGDLDGDGTIAAVDANGLPNINPDGLLPDIII